MVKQFLKDKLCSLDLTNSQILDKLSLIINTNFNVVDTDNDKVQDKLTINHLISWKNGKAYPSNPIIREALSILLTNKKGNYGALILPNEKDAEDILKKAIAYYNNKIINNFEIFKQKCSNNYFEKVKVNPLSQKVTATDVMGCIAYLLLEGYLFSHPLYSKSLNLNSYQKIVNIKSLSQFTNSHNLLINLRKCIISSSSLNPDRLQKQSLLILLMGIRNEKFFY